MRELPAKCQPRDFQGQLLSEGRGERIIAVGDDQKRALAADHIGAIPVLNPRFLYRR
jgi:hypothetical protein